MSDIDLLYKVWDSDALYELQALYAGNYDSVLFEREYLPVLQDFGLIVYDDNMPVENAMETELGRRIYELAQSDVVSTFVVIQRLSEYYEIDAIADIDQMVLACAKKIEEVKE